MRKWPKVERSVALTNGVFCLFFTLTKIRQPYLQASSCSVLAKFAIFLALKFDAFVPSSIFNIDGHERIELSVFRSLRNRVKWHLTEFFENTNKPTPFYFELNFQFSEFEKPSEMVFNCIFWKYTQANTNFNLQLHFPHSHVDCVNFTLQREVNG